MSEDVFQIIRSADMSIPEMGLALQCAPVMAGAKVSNLLCISGRESGRIGKLLTGTGIRIFYMCQYNGRTTFLVYRHKALKESLMPEAVKELLKSLGYKPDDSLGVLLKLFGGRYKSYMMGSGIFPHEMGLFLGYPVGDVIGFMMNKGKNYLYSGYWKVYRDLPAALELFERFDRAKETAVRWVSLGGSIGDLIEVFKDKGGICNEQNLRSLLVTDRKHTGNGTGRSSGNYKGRKGSGGCGRIQRQPFGA